jgi:hypothetical protein
MALQQVMARACSSFANRGVWSHLTVAASHLTIRSAMRAPSSRRAAVMSLLAGGSLAAGCLASDDAMPIPSNGLVLDVALATQLPSGALGIREPDGVVTVNPDTASMFASTSGHALFKYLAICALPTADTLEIDGQRFRGFYGLAPQWETDGCDVGCQHWVSACLLAHANRNGTPVAVSLRGDHPAFAAETERRVGFTYQESAYYGNLFANQLYACIGTGMLGNLLASGEAIIQGRVCGIDNDCGLVNTGVCAQAPANEMVLDRACDVMPTSPGGVYADCHTRAGEQPPRTSPVIHEVVTVYLAP